MVLVKVISAEQAAQLVKDGDMLATTGFVGCGHPEALTAALEKRYLNEGAPRSLGLIYCAGQGDAQFQISSHHLADQQSDGCPNPLTSRG